jgi:hypothetical protein
LLKLRKEVTRPMWIPNWKPITATSTAILALISILTFLFK